MTRHPTARRVHRDPQAPDDAFVAGVLETSAWARQHSRLIVIGSVLLAVLVIGFLIYRSNRQATYEAATAELAQARQTYLAGNPALAVRDLETFLARRGRTAVAAEARLMLAQAYLETGQAEAAASTLERLARDPGSIVGANAALLLAAAHESAGDLQRAEQTYMSVGERARFDFQRFEGLDNAARLRMEQGNVTGAIQLYDRILASLPDEDAGRGVFELRRAEAEGQLAGA